MLESALYTHVGVYFHLKPPSLVSQQRLQKLHVMGKLGYIDAIHLSVLELPCILLVEPAV